MKYRVKTYKDNKGLCPYRNQASDGESVYIQTMGNTGGGFANNRYYCKSLGYTIGYKNGGACGMYTNLAGYFDAIFPVGEGQMRLIREALQFVNGRKILDAACGSGGYSLALSQEGYSVTGIDLDPGMIAYARDKAYQTGLNVTFRIEDMRNIGEKDGEFSAVLCLGNSLPHLLTDEDIQQTLCELYRVLNAEGIVILQNVNYDWVLKTRPRQLPLLEHAGMGVSFSRLYAYRDDGLIDFTTCLTITDGAEKKEYGGTIPLRPLRREEIAMWLGNCGFRELNTYGGFDKRPFSDNTFHTVILAKK